MKSSELHELARKGAEIEMGMLRTRMAQLETLLGRGPRQGRATPVVKKKRSHMSPASRKAASKRMKAYWANKRKVEKK